jgi:DNA-binding response OmpR family regulator
VVDYPLKILVVEDNDNLREATLAFLRTSGHQVLGVAMAEEIEDVCAGFVPDVYVIDLNLPTEDGLSLVKRLREVHPKVGIVITTARAQIGDRVLGYQSGADLYLTKPVAPQELLASIVALSKRLKPEAQDAAGLHLDMARSQLSGPLDMASLTSAESLLLIAFARAAGQTLERWQLAEIISEGKELPNPAALEMRIARLRKKLAQVGAQEPQIRSQRKQGYTLCCNVNLD